MAKNYPTAVVVHATLEVEDPATAYQTGRTLDVLPLFPEPQEVVVAVVLRDAEEVAVGEVLQDAEEGLDQEVVVVEVLRDAEEELDLEVVDAEVLEDAEEDIVLGSAGSGTPGTAAEDSRGTAEHSVPATTRAVLP